MKSSKNGSGISEISVENITSHGLWLFVKGKEYFLDYDKYPYFENATVKELHNVKLLHGVYLYWKDLDIDLEIDNLEHPENYPLISKAKHIKHFAFAEPKRYKY